MKLQDFIRETDRIAPPRSWPEDWPELLKALAFDRAGDWDTAHTIAQESAGAAGSAVHAYLHRKEGVQWNAEYWYRRAGRSPFAGSLDEEWVALAREFLE
jgi:hypothetical protein